jgi:UDP-N-acetylglucosamine kinase
MTDDEIHTEALEYARLHKKEIARKLTDPNVFRPDKVPVSVFMAGSPGAGKTESANNLIARFSKDTQILHIDSDTLRSEFGNYDGSNSSLFQGPTSILADKMHDFALKQSQSFVFDGTLTNLDRARENINRSLKHGRAVFIVYVYQNPLLAWKFVKAREQKDGRHVPREAFIEQYFKARENVNLLKKDFGKSIQVDLVVKNNDGTDFSYRENIDVIDNHIPESYDTNRLLEVITE